MDVKERKLRELFADGKRMEVPLYQRPYVWNEEDNWQPLWETIREAAEQRLDENRGKNNFPSFLGTIVLQERTPEQGTQEVCDVIDGQQRLITLQLFLHAFAVFCQFKDEGVRAGEVKRLVTNTDAEEESESRYKIVPTQQDRKEFLSVMKETQPPTRMSAKSKIRKCYLYFYEEVDKWFAKRKEEGANFPDDAKMLHQVLLRHLIFVVVNLDEKENPQVIFETLNAYGTRLLTIDLIKNHFFRLIENEGERNAIHQKIWCHCFDKEYDEGNWWRKEKGKASADKVFANVFTYYYARFLIKDKFQKDKTFVKLKKHYEKKKGTPIENHIEEFCEYAKCYRSIVKLKEDNKTSLAFDSNLERSLYRLQVIGEDIVTPLLLGHHACFDDDNKALAFFHHLESYLVRRRICGLSNKTYDIDFAKMLGKISEGEGKKWSAETLKDFLLEGKTEFNKWPDDDKVKDAVLHQFSYNKGKNAIRIVLEAIEQDMTTDKNEGFIPAKKKLEIEHIFPRGWKSRKEWESKFNEENEEKREEIINRIGNLTLVTKALNIAASNHSWQDVKKQLLEEHSSLRLNKDLQRYDDWDENTINKRGEELAARIIKIWPKPAQ